MRTKAILPAVLCAALASACGSSPPTRYHVLSPLPGERGAARIDGELLVVSISGFPEYLERSEVVWSETPTTLALEEQDFWAEPLGRAFLRVLADDLTALGRPAVPTGPLAQQTSGRLWILLEVSRFDALAGGDVELAAIWSVTDALSAAVVAPRRSLHRVAGSGTSGEAIAASLSAAVHELAREIVAALPDEAGS